MPKIKKIFASAFWLCLLANLSWANSGIPLSLPPSIGELLVTQESNNTVTLSGQILGSESTVKVRWGDEDRGLDVDPSMAWDNEVTIWSSQKTGAFSTTLEIPNIDKIYYFRVIASNNAGSAVSRNVAVFLSSATEQLGGFSNLPTLIKGEAGTFLSAIVVADLTSPIYQAFNMPAGLSINGSTGEISGTPTVGGSHTITVLALGGTSEFPKKAIGEIIYSAPTTGPKFGNSGAQNVGIDSALLLAEIEQSGAHSNYDVDFFWGSADGGTVAAGWDSSAISVGTGQEGFYGKEINGLVLGQTYYYRARTHVLQDPIDHAGNDLKLWVDASKLNQVPDLWVDKSGSGNDLNKSEGSIELVLNAQNGLNVLRTDNFQNEFYSRSISNLSAGDQTWMILYKSRSENTTDSGHDGILGYKWDDGFWRFESGHLGEFNGRMRWFDQENSVWRFTTDQMSHSNQWNLYSATFHEASGSYNVRLWQNGTLHSTNTSGEDLLEDNGSIYIMRADATTPTSAIGDYAEVLIFSSVDSTITQKMEGYLMHKWGLAGNLPSAHTYKSSAPSTTSWSATQTFTTPTVSTAPVLGAQSTANLTTTSVDLQVVLEDSGNAATTIYFYYGKTDGGTNPASWDSNIIISNPQDGINLMASINGLTSSSTYFFRAKATNFKGSVWSSSTTAFTTLFSSVMEDRDAISHSDLVGWWKLDGNLNDSSGNNRHGTPPIIQGSSLWLDAADTSSNSIQLGSGKVQTWKDKSGNGHDAIQSAGASRPSPLANGLNGFQVLSFDGTTDYLVSSTFVLKNAHSIYAVAKSDSIGWRRILCSASPKYYFLGNGSGNNNFATFYGSGSWTDTNTNSPASSVGSASILGVISDGTNATPYQNATALNNKPSNMGGAAPAGLMVGKHETSNSQYWDGQIAEIIIFNKNHSDAEREEVEGYLAKSGG